MGNGARDFYDREYGGEQYASAVRPSDHSAFVSLRKFIERYQLSERRCLEVGCGRGAFQDLVPDYTGVDFSASAAPYLHKPFHCASATALPFADDSFDAAWSITVLEHIPEPEQALAEMRRVLRPGGMLFLAPAWQCRPWAADGYPVRPYSDFGWTGRLIKASIPLRNSVAWRSLFIIPRRMARLATAIISGRPTRFRYRKLKANYEKFWMSDSDACASMDPYEAILWFLSRGDECLEPARSGGRFFFRTGPVVFRIR